eukprot:scaffold1923_cov160-Amphora_coffeaeformis.AAC.5
MMNDLFLRNSSETYLMFLYESKHFLIVCERARLVRRTISYNRGSWLVNPPFVGNLPEKSAWKIVVERSSSELRADLHVWIGRICDVRQAKKV